jgi:hypothetical protein
VGRYMLSEVRTLNKLLLTIILAYFSNPVIAGEWFKVKNGTASVDFNVDKLEDKLWNFVLESKYEFHQRKSYLYQYQFFNDNLLRIHAYCNMTFNSDRSFFKKSDLTKNFLGVVDGGTCYFQLVYDTNSKQFISLSVNGVA